LPWWPCFLVLHSLMRRSVGTVGIRKIATLSPFSVFVLLSCLQVFPSPPPGSVHWYRTTKSSSAGTLLPHLLPCPSVPIVTGIPCSSDGFSTITRDHMRRPVISSWVSGRRPPPPTAGTCTAEWLSSPGGSSCLYPLPRFTLRSHSH